MTELRRIARYPLVAAVEIYELGSGACIQAQISDLSPFGCYVDTLNPLPHRTDVKLRITNEGETFTAVGSVAFSTARMGMGIKFTSVEQNQKKILEKWLDRFAALYF